MQRRLALHQLDGTAKGASGLSHIVLQIIDFVGKLHTVRKATPFGQAGS
ncbi:MAG TPA: hypothetical protein VGK29_12435 [Paludibaculum sp.]